MSVLLRHVLRASIALLLVSCERSGDGQSRDSAVPPALVNGDSSAPASVNSGWNADAGPTLLVAGDAPDIAQVIFPEVTDSTLGDTTLMDLAPVSGATVELFSRGGRIGTAMVAGPDTTSQADSSDESCDDWPMVRLRSERGSRAGTWTAALLAGHARAIALDSIEGCRRGIQLACPRRSRVCPARFRTTRRVPFAAFPIPSAPLGDSVPRRVSTHWRRKYRDASIRKRIRARNRSFSWSSVIVGRAPDRGRSLSRGARLATKARSKTTTFLPRSQSALRGARRWSSVATWATACRTHFSSVSDHASGGCAGSARRAGADRPLSEVPGLSPPPHVPAHQEPLHLHAPSPGRRVSPRTEGQERAGRAASSPSPERDTEARSLLQRRVKPRQCPVRATVRVRRSQWR